MARDITQYYYDHCYYQYSYHFEKYCGQVRWRRDKHLQNCEKVFLDIEQSFLDMQIFHLSVFIGNVFKNICMILINLSSTNLSVSTTSVPFDRTAHRPSPLQKAENNKKDNNKNKNKKKDIILDRLLKIKRRKKEILSDCM